MRAGLLVNGIVGTVATFALVGALAVCAAGCGSAATQPEEAGGEAEVGMANPWSDVSSAAEAGSGAFNDSFDVPETLGIGDISWQSPTFRYMDGIAEADYEGGAVQACVRKGKGVSGEALHGVYEDPGQPWIAWTVDAGGVEVSCLGYEKGIANVLEWGDGAYNYSVYVTGLGGENYGVVGQDIPALVRAIY